MFKSNYNFKKKVPSIVSICCVWAQFEWNSCDLVSVVRMNSISHNGSRVCVIVNGVRVEISKMSACRFVKSNNQKELHGVPWRCWNWDWITVRHCRTEKGIDNYNRDALSYWVSVFYSVVIVENVVCCSRMHCVPNQCTACRVIFTFFRIITEVH